MNKTTMTLALVIAVAAVFAVASTLNVAMAQTSDTMPDDNKEQGDYKDGEHDGKSCPNKERKSQQSEQSS